MAELKTQKNTASVADFLATLPDEQQRNDSAVIIEIMKKVTKSEPSMWGTAIIGLGYYKVTYANGKTLDWFRMGLSPRKGAISLYFVGYNAVNDPLLKSLGKYKTGKGCIYVKRLADIDMKVLEKLIKAAK